MRTECTEPGCRILSDRLAEHLAAYHGYRDEQAEAIVLDQRDRAALAALIEQAGQRIAGVRSARSLPTTLPDGRARAGAAMARRPNDPEPLRAWAANRQERGSRSRSPAKRSDDQASTPVCQRRELLAQLRQRSPRPHAEPRGSPPSSSSTTSAPNVRPTGARTARHTAERHRRATARSSSRRTTRLRSSRPGSAPATTRSPAAHRLSAPRDTTTIELQRPDLRVSRRDQTRRRLRAAGSASMTAREYPWARRAVTPR